MRNLIVAFALTTLPYPAIANDPGIVVATNPEKASGFRNLAECHEALGGSDKLQGKMIGDEPNRLHGSMFNRTAGNTSRCEIVHGEALIVVYPKGYEERRPTR